ncbi:hypothetical protein [Mucilaginibacter jinjuensis]|uniref:TMF family protein n=1 Tax=Mucilaginibacter jinjuensis TaxID=1176721 RepID=A0ABY7TDB4_9SPHI|nr:hypothetical protein [Mucilaginibacter jinjuensis]WCT13688.1 hypothetical protein PQO05_07030 [Mucilaginibacter jinjuensis]
MKKKYLLILMGLLFSSLSYAQIDIPNASGGPVAPGSWIRFLSAGDATSIQENWGINITGSSYQPVKIINSSLLVGYTSGNGGSFGSGNAFISGNVGIGTTTPGAKLDINGDASVQYYGRLSSARDYRNSYTNLFLGGAISYNGDGNYTVLGDGGSNYFGAIRMDNSGGNAGAINFYSGTSIGGSNYTISNANLNSYLRMTIINNKVGIGTANPDASLAVAGVIHSQAVKVDMVGWSDYVFNRSYKLVPLRAVKAYIDQNHHLPDVPSEEQVKKDGIDLGEMNSKLLKKIEELTLYLIQEKQPTDQQIKTLKNEINKIKHTKRK